MLKEFLELPFIVVVNGQDFEPVIKQNGDEYCMLIYKPITPIPDDWENPIVEKNYSVLLSYYFTSEDEFKEACEDAKTLLKPYAG